jgi:hypothetical protein
MTRVIEQLKNVLTELRRTGGIDASIIVSRDGLLIVSDVPEDVHVNTFAAMSATILGAAEMALSELGKGILDRIIVESKKVRVIVKGAGPKALLVVMLPPEVGLGLALVEIEKTADKIQKLL